MAAAGNRFSVAQFMNNNFLFDKMKFLNLEEILFVGPSGCFA